ncbi:MAG: hypothetical protein M1827_004551 [Pycnora praestabilis]|nr:MAG: hypothetical protein M1827_004551 [Pycnora praestabilis]
MLRSHLATDVGESCSSLFRRRPYVVSSVALFFFLATIIHFSSSQRAPYIPFTPSKDQNTPFRPSIGFNGTWDWRRDSKNLLLEDGQCEQAFPGLFEDVNRAVNDRRSRKITLEEVDSIDPINGYVRGMIYEQESTFIIYADAQTPHHARNCADLTLQELSPFQHRTSSTDHTPYFKLYIIAKQGGIYSRELATLHALHRAVLTSPTPLPNVEFTLISDDKIGPQATWAYARRTSDTAIWLMPDFGYWSWPETKVGGYTEVQRKARDAEAGDGEKGGNWTWSRKHPRLVWRGASMGLPLREQFLASTASKPWADVREIKWHDDASMAQDLLSMDEHCHYAYLAHTEGNSYSGRLKYLQNCRSVIVAHEMDWIQHYSPLLKSSGQEQNYVQVRRDFADLENTMQMLLAYPDEGERIAQNSVTTFRDRYLTIAAEACYWRRLIRGWAEVSAFEVEFWKVDDQGKKLWRGVPWESFALERRLEWDPY